MKITLLFLGKTKVEYQGVIEDFQKKLLPFCQLEIKILKDETVRGDIAKVLKKEEEKILNSISERDCLIVLDEKGKSFDTIGFARWMSSMTLKTGSFTFLIGSSYGLSETMKKRGHLLLSLSSLTLSHQVARVVLLEQLYRAFTVQRGIDYHR